MVAERGQPTLVRICDPDGRPRGTGFFADDLGTVVTSHEAVDGLNRAVLHVDPGRGCTVEGDRITPLPERDLALLSTNGLGPAPLVIGAQRARPAGSAVRIRIGEWLDAELAGTAEATYTYTSTHRFHPLAEVLELALPEEAYVQLRLSKEESGTPVLDAETGAVLAVLGAALHSPGRAAVFAVPLRGACTLEPGGPVDGALGALLVRNGATVPGFGRDLNLAGALQLTATSVGAAVERAGRPVERPEVAGAFREFAESEASVAALVGSPGTGRSTELAALAGRRACGAEPAPTVWLRGAGLREGDGSVREAVGRALAAAGRIVAASLTAPGVGDPGLADADVVARLARDAGRPLLVILDGPEEMPARLAYELRRWTAGTASWLQAAGARMAIACRTEYWEQAGRYFPAGMLFDPHGRWSAGEARSAAGGGRSGSGEAGGTEEDGPIDSGDGSRPPPCVPLGYLPPRQAGLARIRYGLPDGCLTAGDAGHPLALRMLAELRGAMAPTGYGTEGAGSGDGPEARRDGAAPPNRPEIFSAHLALVSLRIAVRIAAVEGRVVGGNALRRLAARASGRLHEAARRCLGPGQGELATEVFEEVFPWGGGWASAVLAEGMLVPAGEGYRFADEEFADWVQGCHLELDTALDSLIHRRPQCSGEVPVPRHRIGPVVEALLLRGREHGAQVLARRLEPLAGASTGAAGGDADWWAAHLLGRTLLRVPDARPYLPLLHVLAERTVAQGRAGRFGPWFWRALPLPTADRIELLRLLLPADPPHGAAAGQGGGRFLDAVGELLAADPRAVQPLLCGWFDDRRELRRRADVPGRHGPVVAAAAQALLYTHRRGASDELTDLLLRTAHPRADELLEEFLHDDTSAVCRAVVRWACDGDVERRMAAAAYGLRAAPLADTDADRELLRHAALALLRRPDSTARSGAPLRRPQGSLHGQALAVLIHDPVTRYRHFDTAVGHFASTGSPELGEAFVQALTARPEPVLDAFRALLHQPGAGACAVLCALAEVRDPALARRIAALVHEYAELRPETAGEAVAAFVRRRLAHGPETRGVLRPLVAALLRAQHAPFRTCLAGALGGAEGPLRDELVDVLLEGEHDLAVLDAFLEEVVRRDGGAQAGVPEENLSGAEGAVTGAGIPEHWSAGTGETVRRIGLSMVRTPGGAARFDDRLVELAREIPGFAGLVRTWIAASPHKWTAIVGPSAHDMCDSLSGPG